MLKTRFLLILYIIVSFFPVVYAQAADDLIFSKLKSKETSIKNPFQSQLPKIEPQKPPENESNTSIKKPIEKPEPPKPIEEIPKKEEKPLPNVTISGIIWDSDRPQAIINETVVDIGDTILGIQIIDIRKEGIDGLFDERIVTLKP